VYSVALFIPPALQGDHLDEPAAIQKVLRLHEARRLMLFQSMDAGEACSRVGYVSPSQFSREYSRFFGSAPVKDIARLRDDGFAPVDGAGGRHGFNAGKMRELRIDAHHFVM
jgi:AraC-like DNA-binding protein